MTDVDEADRLALSRLPKPDPVAKALGHRHTTVLAGESRAHVLALDIGTSMGWALNVGGVVTSGSKSFAERSRETRGDRLVLFAQWLGTMNACALSLVAYEHVMFHGGGPNPARMSSGVLAAHAYGQFEGVLLLFCAQRQIPVRSVPTATLKKATTGKGNAKKQDVIAAVKARGFTPSDDDEADALAVLLWALA